MRFGPLNELQQAWDLQYWWYKLRMVYTVFQTGREEDFSSIKLPYFVVDAIKSCIRYFSSRWTEYIFRINRFPQTLYKILNSALLHLHLHLVISNFGEGFFPCTLYILGVSALATENWPPARASVHNDIYRWLVDSWQLVQNSKQYCRFSQDVTKIETTKLLILLRFNFMMYKSSLKLLIIQIFAPNEFLVLRETTLEFLSFWVTRHSRDGRKSCYVC